jgi:hypothetical protein
MVKRIVGSNECSRHGKLGIERAFCVEGEARDGEIVCILWGPRNVLLESASLWLTT